MRLEWIPHTCIHVWAACTCSSALPCPILSCLSWSLPQTSLAHLQLLLWRSQSRHVQMGWCLLQFTHLASTQQQWSLPDCLVGAPCCSAYQPDSHTHTHIPVSQTYDLGFLFLDSLTFSWIKTQYYSFWMATLSLSVSATPPIFVKCYQFYNLPTYSW